MHFVKISLQCTLMRNPRELAADIEGALGAIVAHGQQQRGVTVRKLLGDKVDATNANKLSTLLHLEGAAEAVKNLRMETRAELDQWIMDGPEFTHLRSALQ